MTVTPKLKINVPALLQYNFNPSKPQSIESFKNNEQEQRQAELFSKMSILTVEQREDVLETSDNEDPCTLKKGK